MDPFLGQIISVGFNWAPVGWYPCDGRTLSIADHTALYALLGTTYGGDGQATFGLPDLRGRVPLSMGTGKGLSTYTQGQTVGVEQVSLTSANTPLHGHAISFSALDETTENPMVNVPKGGLTVGSNTQALLPGFYAPGPGTQPLMGGTIGPSTGGGGGQPHENRQPFLALNYIIAWTGTYPSQT